MNRCSHLISYVVLLSSLLIIIRIGVAQTQEGMNIRGRIVFDYPKSPESKIELNLNGKFIGLVAKGAATEWHETLDGIYVRSYPRNNADLGEVNRYYENKLTKEGWDVIAKVKEADEIIEVRILSDQDMVNGIFIIVEGAEETMLLNIFGRIIPEMTGDLLASLEIDSLGNFDIDLDDLDMGFELNLPEFDADYKPKRQSVPSGKREFSEQFDWTLEGAGISVISAEAINGGITLKGSVRDDVIVRAFKQVRARNQSDAEKFAKEVQIHVERRGKEIKIYSEKTKSPWGIGVSVTYEIQCPPAVDLHLRTTNANIKINGVAGAVDAATSNGPIVLHGGAGHIRAVTSNGNIEASVGRLADEGIFVTTNGSMTLTIHQGVAPISASTTNGSVSLKLPGDFSGHLDAKTTNGHVRSDFPVTFTDKSENQLAGKISDGGPANVILLTTNGSINLGNSSTMLDKQ